MILVTGAAGFIGSHLAAKLLEMGEQVTGLDNFDDFYDPALKKKNVAVLSGIKGFRFEAGDIRDEAALKKLFEANRFDCVVHLAARPGVQPSLRNPAVYADVNVKGTVNILQQMVETGVKKLVFASSSSVYGDSPVLPFHEEKSAPSPVSPYGATKLAGEILIQTYQKIYGFDAVMLRFFTVYGPRQRPDMAISKFFRQILAGEPIALYGDGSSKRDYTHIQDTLKGILSSLKKCCGIKTYNLGRSETVSLKHLVELIERAAKKKAVIEYKPERLGDPLITHADVTRAETELDYRPTIRIEDGIADYAVWIKKQRE
jgi:UDP-glucuronate 4-epimerase